MPSEIYLKIALALKSLQEMKEPNHKHTWQTKLFRSVSSLVFEKVFWQAPTNVDGLHEKNVD